MTYVINRDTKVYVSTVNEGFDSTNTRMFNALRGIEYNVPSGVTKNSRSSLNERQKRNATPYTSTISRVTFSIPIYIRPYTNLFSNIDCVERFFWESFIGKTSSVFQDNQECIFTFNDSRQSRLLPIQIYLSYGNKIYKFSNAIIEKIEVPIDINNISMLSIRGTAEAYEEVDILDAPNTSGYDGEKLQDIVISKYSTLSLTHLGESYNLPLTGGSIVLDNNITHNTRPKVGHSTTFGSHYTGDLDVEGFLKCYLRLGDRRAADFLFQRLDEVRLNPSEEVFSIASITIGNKEAAHIEFNFGEVIVNPPNFSNSNVVSLTFQFMTKNTENTQVIYRL